MREMYHDKNTNYCNNKYNLYGRSFWREVKVTVVLFLQPFQAVFHFPHFQAVHPAHCLDQGRGGAAGVH